MKYIKRIIVAALTVVMVISVNNLSAIDVSAAKAGDSFKGKTVCEALGMDGAAYMNWLLSHEHDNYYLGTPYRPYDHRNPIGDCKGAYGTLDIKGQPGMNCMGFVWHVLYKATSFSNGNQTAVNKSMGRLSFYRGLNITRRYFANKQEMLDSGYAEKGDIIWMILDQNEDVNNQYDHTGIYWGDGHSDVLWHSNTVTGGQGSCNAISAIYPMKDRNTMYIVLKVGAVTLDTPKLISAVNTEDGIEVKWDKVDGAARYRYYVRENDTWKRLGDTTDTSFVYKEAAVGEECIFTVRCVTSCNKGFTSMFDADGITCRRRDPEQGDLCLLGDVNDDGEVTITDASLIQMYLSEIKVPNFVEAAADADEDGTIQAMDATVIRRLVAGLQSFPNIDTPVESTE